MDFVLAAPVAGLSAILFAVYLAHRVLNKPTATTKIAEISNLIKICATAYLNRQFKTVIIFGASLAVLLMFISGAFAVLTFVVGALFSAASAYIGVHIAIRANARTANAAKNGFKDALAIASRSGTVIGLSLAGLGLLSVSALYMLLGDPIMLVGLGFGASLIGLFARVGGGIYTKAADMSADLIGKVEMGLSEDDARNPAVIADQVGDNVGDIAGTGSDVFQSYVCTLVAAMILGFSMYGRSGLTYPLVVLGFGIIASIFGSFFIKTNDGDARQAINKSMYASAALVSVAAIFASWNIFHDFNAFYATFAGVLAVILFALLTEHYTSPDKKPVKAIAMASGTGPATTILMGFATSLESTAAPIIVFSAAVMAAYHFEGLYGITLVAVGFLSIIATFIAMSSYGPIVDNARGLVEMTGAGAQEQKVMDKLDAVGNVTKAVCKVYAIGTSALAQVALFSAYINAAQLQTIDAMNPTVITGMLIGGMVSFVFCSMIIKAVGNAAYTLIREVRRQFSENFGLANGETKPDYARCVDISTRAALRGMLLPAFLSVAIPLTVGLTLGKEAMGGLIVGNLITMLPLALLMSISGAAWDNAKKFIEAGNLGGKGTPAHTAAIIGDTVGDSLKDAAGPSLNIFINLIGTVALLYASSLATSSLIH
ncbi:MAG: sodium-translocating pyrophosphatase [Candidatus Bathyarchaeia archaeon]